MIDRRALHAVGLVLFAAVSLTVGTLDLTMPALSAFMALTLGVYTVGMVGVLIASLAAGFRWRDVIAIEVGVGTASLAGFVLVPALL